MRYLGSKHLPAAAACLLLAILTMTCPAGTARAQDSSGSNGEEEMDAQQLPDFMFMWDFSDPAGTEQQFRGILPQAEASGDTLYLVELETQIARTLGLQKKFEEAHALLDRVEQRLAAGEPEALLRGRMRYLLERGRAFNSGGSPDRAEPLFLEAWELGQGKGVDNLTIDAAHMLGIVTTDEESLEWNHRALALAEQTSDEQAANWKGALYNNMGWTYMDMHEPAQALELFQKGVDFREEQGHGEQSRMIAHWTVARALRGLDRHGEALKKLQYIADNFPGYAEDGFWHEELGENLLATGELEGAKAAFQAAIPLLEAMGWVAGSYPGRIERLQAIVDNSLPLLGIGDNAPDFELPNQDGEAVSLAGMNSGKPVVLVFYKKDDTGG